MQRMTDFCQIVSMSRLFEAVEKSVRYIIRALFICVMETAHVDGWMFNIVFLL